MDAISLIPNTYFTLMPTELRKLLYLYVNTAGLKYKITYKRIINIRASNIYWFTIILLIDELYLKANVMLPFIEFLKAQMIFDTSRKISPTDFNISSLITLRTTYE